MANIVAIIGGGVIGGGWAARFLLMGWDVQVFDPDPQAMRKIGEVLDNARRSLPGLSDVMLPDEGQLTYCETISEAVQGASWIQESIPERLDIKRKTFQKIQETCAPDAVIGSSTSGFKTSELQGCATRPDQIMVTPPVQPGLFGGRWIQIGPQPIKNTPGASIEKGPKKNPRTQPLGIGPPFGRFPGRKNLNPPLSAPKPRSPLESRGPGPPEAPPFGV